MMNGQALLKITESAAWWFTVEVLMEATQHVADDDRSNTLTQFGYAV